MSEITEKLKVLGEKWANLPDCKEANEIADEICELVPELLSKVEELEKAAAEMRQVLGWSYRWLGCEDCSTVHQCEECKDMSYAIDHALSNSCGSEYIHRDEVKPLRDALKSISDSVVETDDRHYRHICMEWLGSTADKALAHSEKLLKGETK